MALINESFATRAWPDQSPIGESFFIYGGNRELIEFMQKWLAERGDFHSILRITADRLQRPRDIKPLLRGAY